MLSESNFNSSGCMPAFSTPEALTVSGTESNKEYLINRAQNAADLSPSSFLTPLLHNFNES